MSYYYKYEFISPQGVFATVQEELKSYFDSGAIDNLMFNTYLNKCLEKLGKGTYYITEEILNVEDYECRLPDNFYLLREAWLCTDVSGFPYQSANSFYSQAASTSTIQVTPVISGGVPCTNTNDCSECGEADCMPELIQAVYKTNNEVNVSYRKTYLLKPGNISTKSHCSSDCKNFGSSAPDSFDIRDNKFVVNFRCGKVYITFYATEYDNSGNQLIPDNFRIKEYLEAYIKYKMFETLSNVITDETFNQINQKMVYYKSLSDEAFIMADLEMKKQTAYEKQLRIKQQLNSLNRFELPSSSIRGTWRRNGT